MRSSTSSMPTENLMSSPKKPALMEAVALHFADNTDAKMETMKEIFSSTDDEGWLGYNRLVDSNIRKTSES